MALHRSGLAWRRIVAHGFLASLFAIPSALHAQDETLIKSGSRPYGGFGGPAARITSMAGETMIMGGAGGAVLFDRRFALGVAGFGGTRSVDTRFGGLRRRGEMDVGYGGATFEVITRPSRLVHATFGALLGAGSVSVYPDARRPDDEQDDETVFGVFEPQVGVELNVSRWFRLGVTAGYRATFGEQNEQLVNTSLSGASGSLVFRFGKF
jgi:hypothetical protein